MTDLSEPKKESFPTPPSVEAPLIDSHAHLDAQEFDPDRDEVIRRARANRLEGIISCGTTVASSEKNTSLAKNYDLVYAAVGIHPHETSSIEAGSMSRLRALTKKTKVVGIGETGLDYHYNFSLPEIQRKSFSLHIRLARETGLPLIIHCRNAEEDLLRILKEEKASEVGGVIHSFTGTPETAKACLEIGFYLGVSGIVTFKSAEILEKLFSAIPLENLLLETDSPYLAPTPHRGKRNEPAFVANTALKLGELKSILLEEICQATTQNAKKLFRLP